MSGFNMTIENFEGPIDALLKLIEKRKLPINDITLVDVTDEYIRFVSSLDSIALSERTQFIFIASTLTLIKSKSLLPALDLTEEEEDDIEDLKRRINILKAYQEGGEVLKKYIRKKPLYYFSRPRKREIVFQPHESIHTSTILESLYSVFNQIPEPELKKKEGTVTIAVHIEHMMDSLEKRIRKAIATDFSSFLGDHIDPNMEPKQVRVYKVVGFLAMLELVKKGSMHVHQKKNFTNINIEQI